MGDHLLMTIDPVLLGARLARSRLACGQAVQQVATRLGVLPSDIEDIERGVRRPRATELVKLAMWYGRPVSEFLRSADANRSRCGSGPRQHARCAAALAFMAGDLTEAQLARRLGLDIVSAREIVWEIVTTMRQTPGSPDPEQDDAVRVLDAFAAQFADLTPEEIERETALALAEVREEQRAYSDGQ